MTNTPFISVIVPTFNRSDLISKTIHSLQNQHNSNYEIIIVDDGSTDNTEEVVSSLLNEKTRYVKKDNAERAAARNYGASIAKGDYVNFFDSDDLALPNHVDEAIKVINDHSNPEWFHLGYAWADVDGKVFRDVNGYEGGTLNHYMSSGNPLSCNGVFVRRDIAMVNKFNEDRALSASEDYELWCRLAARYPLFYSNTITSWVIDHEARSVRKINGEKLLLRLDLLLLYLTNNAEVVSYFGSGISRIKMDTYSYGALHLAEVPSQKAKSVFYLLKALAADLSLVKKRRFFAVIKNILIKW